MTTDQLADAIEARVSRDVRDPVKQLDLTMDLIRIVEAFVLSRPDVLAVMEREPCEAGK